MVRIRFPPARSPLRNLMPTISAQPAEVADPPIPIHPDVSGRPHVLMMLERLYHHMIGHPGVRFVTMNEMADDFARRSPRKR